MTARRVWTPEEDRQMLAWTRSGVSHSAMSILLRSHKNAISVRLNCLLDADGGRVEPNPRTVTAKSTLPAPVGPRSPGGRKCLRCGQVFASAHAGNRMCYSCKQHGPGANPFYPI